MRGCEMRARYLVAIGLLLAVPCGARIITVDDDGPADFNNIQAAIDDANDGDVVVVQPGIYTGEGNRDIDFKGKAITVCSKDPNDPNIVATTIVDCNGTETDPHRGFYFHNGEDNTSVLSGFTITNGYVKAVDGAAIVCYVSSPTIGNCIFCGNQVVGRCDIVGCWGGYGAAISCENSRAVIADCTFAENIGIGAVYYLDSTGIITNCLMTGNKGSAMYARESNLTVAGCTINNNEAHDGAALYSDTGTSIIVESSTMIGNRAVDSGGAICVRDSSAKIYNCTLIENSTVEGHGGAVMCWANGSITLTNSILARNRAAYNGGAIWCIGKMTLSGSQIVCNKANVSGGGLGFQCPSTISNTLICGNTADANGGGIYFPAPYSNLTLANCTISANRARYNGGGICCGWGSAAVLTNCIVWGNWAAQGYAICMHLPPSDVRNLVRMNIWYSTIEGGSSDIYVGLDSLLGWKAENIQADPYFAEPGYWDPNGTPEDINDDFWVDGDYHLKSQAGRWDPNSQSWVKDDVTSPCIDAGEPMSPIGHEPFPNGGIINMGAYGGTAEASKSYFGEPICEVIIAGDINGDCKVDFADFVLMARHWLQQGR